MKKSPPKIVKIDLNKYNNQYNTAPQKYYSSKNHQQNIAQFSFSQENYKQSKNINKNLFNKKNSPNKSKPPFKFSPIKPYEYYSPSSKSRSKQKQIKSQHYQKINSKDKLYKKSMQKLKYDLLNKSQRSKMKQKQLTKQILKKISKYATSRSKDKSMNESNKKQKINKKKDFKVQYFGFDDKKHTQFYKQRQQQRQDSPIKIQINNEQEYRSNKIQIKQDLEQIDVYRNFQMKYNQELQNSSKKQKQQSQNKKYSSVHSPHINFSQNSKSHQKNNYNFDEITQQKIQLIVQIFDLCQKDNESDKLIKSDFYNLLAQLQRLYVIKVLQKNKKQQKNQQEYSELLKQFQQTFKIIFYRKAKNDIYDTIFYLYQDNLLDTICQIFKKIKQILLI